MYILSEIKYGQRLFDLPSYHRIINAKPEVVDNIIKETVCLHNFLRRMEMHSSDEIYCPPAYLDRESNGQIMQ